MPKRRTGVMVAVVAGSLDRVQRIRMEPERIADEMRRHLRCDDIDFEQVSPVHTFYYPVDGVNAKQGWYVLVRATDHTGEQLVDVTPEDIGEMPRLLAGYERARTVNAALVRAAASLADDDDSAS